jgi:hypothetical protein
MEDMKKYVYLTFFLVLFLVGCESPEMKYYDTKGNVPTVVTGDVEKAFGVGASITGSVMADNGSNIQAKGICISTNPDPKLILDGTAGFSEDSSSGELTIGDYSSIVVGTEENTTYYYRAYALNAAGIAYGEVKNFNTGETPIVIAKYQSELYGATFEQEMQVVPEADYYAMVEPYGYGYNIRILVSGTNATVDKQVISDNFSGYGTGYVEGEGTFDGKVFDLGLEFTVSAGSFGVNNEIITLP